MNYLNKKTIEDIDIAHKKVLLRCDFNVPIIDGKITEMYNCSIKNESYNVVHKPVVIEI